ncbi:MAG TPA: anti-sigma factor [Propionibacteriaceae bacterium]|nr:anti-sigma factor [Propionibacteriaceae bacterium]
MSEVHGAVGSYVVDALDPEERADFESHLATCEYCRTEVDKLSEAVSKLAALEIIPPPTSVRDNVLASIRRVRPLPAPGDHERTRVRVDELQVQRLRRRNRVLTVLVAAVTLAAVSLGGWTYTALQAQQASQTAANQLQTELLAAPDARVYPVELKAGGRASFVVARSLNRAAFVGNLPALSPDRRYQLWTISAGGQPRPDLLLSGGTGQAQELRTPIADAAGLAISIEPSTGATTPSAVQGQVKL